MSQPPGRFRAFRDGFLASICVIAIALSGARLVSNWNRAPGGVEGTGSSATQAVEFTRRNSTPGEFDPVVLLAPVSPITDAPFIPASEAPEDRAPPNELVLGLTVDGESRAYPINMLTGPEREIINDTLGGRRLAATW